MNTVAAPSVGSGQEVRALPAHSGPGRDVIRFIVIFAVAGALLLNLYRLSVSPQAPFAGDWVWYADGLHRFLSGGPIYAPELLNGPYQQLDPAFAFTYSLAPSLLPALLPFALIPAGLQAFAWSMVMLACVIAAFALVWPDRGSRASTVLLALLIALLPPVLFGVWWANISCVVALGTSLVIVGHRRNDRRLMVAGLVLAGAAKVLPAVPLAAWLLWRHREWRPVMASVAIGGLLCLPAVLLFGPHVVVDFLVVMSNSQQETTTLGNVAPALMLEPTIGSFAATAVSLAAAGVLVLIGLWRRTDDRAALLCFLLASCAFVPNLWVHWLIAPMLAGIWWLGTSVLTRLDVVMAPRPVVASGAVQPLPQPG